MNEQLVLALVSESLAGRLAGLHRRQLAHVVEQLAPSLAPGERIVATLDAPCGLERRLHAATDHGRLLVGRAGTFRGRLKGDVDAHALADVRVVEVSPPLGKRPAWRLVLALDGVEDAYTVPVAWADELHVLVATVAEARPRAA